MNGIISPYRYFYSFVLGHVIYSLFSGDSVLCMYIKT